MELFLVSERSLQLPLLPSDGNRDLIHFPVQTRHRFSTETINTVALTDTWPMLIWETNATVFFFIISRSSRLSVRAS